MRNRQQQWHRRRVALAVAGALFAARGVTAAPVTTAATSSSGEPLSVHVATAPAGGGSSGAATGFGRGATTAGAIALPDGPLAVTITGLQGLTQYRGDEKEAWKGLKVGQVVGEGSEFRTGPKSAIQFTIPPGQTVTLDRLSTIKVLRATFADGKVMTNLGMKFGRTRYDVETGGIEHRSTISSPGSTLAVRGTQVSLYDQPPFGPEAISLTGRAEFRARGARAVAVGSAGGSKAGVASGDQSAGDSAIREAASYALSSPRTSTFRGDLGVNFQAGSAVTQYQLPGIFEVFKALDEQAGAKAFLRTTIGVIPIDQSLQITMDWIGKPGSNVDLTVISPLGEVVDKTRVGKNQVASGGQHSGDATAGENGIGLESVSWVIHFPAGLYTVRAKVRTPDSVQVEYNAVLDPQGKNIPVKTLPLKTVKGGGTLVDRFTPP